MAYMYDDLWLLFSMNSKFGQKQTKKTKQEKASVFAIFNRGTWLYLESHRSVLGSNLYVGMKVISPSMKSVKAFFVCLWTFSYKLETGKYCLFKETERLHNLTVSNTSVWQSASLISFPSSYLSRNTLCFNFSELNRQDDIWQTANISTVYLPR